MYSHPACQPDSAFPRRVVKVGGSLLDLPGLWRILTTWLDAQPALENLLVVGGGSLADQVRKLDQCYGLPRDTAHWLAIRAMDLNGFVLSRLLPGARWTADYPGLLTNKKSGIGILPVFPARQAGSLSHTTTGQDRRFLAVEVFLRREEPVLPGVRLPSGWHVTSDSIAARLAVVCHARELVLLKSTIPAACGTSVSVAQAASLRLVDEFFPASAAPLHQIRVVNLRDAGFAEVRLTA